MYCPECYASAIEMPYTHVSYANSEGEPVEQAGKATYCTDSLCYHHRESIEEPIYDMSEAIEEVFERLYGRIDALAEVL